MMDVLLLLYNKSVYSGIYWTSTVIFMKCMRIVIIIDLKARIFHWNIKITLIIFSNFIRFHSTFEIARPTMKPNIQINAITLTIYFIYILINLMVNIVIASAVIIYYYCQCLMESLVMYIMHNLIILCRAYFINPITDEKKIEI